MLSQAMRRMPAAELLEAARSTCAHSLPGTGYRLPTSIRPLDSRFLDVEGSS